MTFWTVIFVIPSKNKPEVFCILWKSARCLPCQSSSLPCGRLAAVYSRQMNTGLLQAMYRASYIVGISGRLFKYLLILGGKYI